MEFLTSNDELLFSKIALVLSCVSRNNKPTFLDAAKVKLFKDKERSLFKLSSSKRISTMKTFLEQIDENTESPQTIYIYALCLLQKLETKSCFTQLTPSTVQAIFGTCFTLAFKVLEDEVFTAEDFAIIVGMEKDQLINTETIYIEALSFNLTITPEDMNLMTYGLDALWASRITPHTRKLLSTCTCLTEIIGSPTQKFGPSPTPVTKKSISSPFLSRTTQKSNAIKKGGGLKVKSSGALPELDYSPFSSASGSPKVSFVHFGGVILVV